MIGRKIITFDGRTGVIIEQRFTDHFRLFAVDIDGEEHEFYPSEIDVYNHA